MNLPYRIHAISGSAGWLVQHRYYPAEIIQVNDHKEFVAAKYETLAYCKTLDEAVDYLFAWKEINT